MGIEKRKGDRKATTRVAWVVTSDRSPPRLCVLCDLSQAGARLRLANNEPMPKSVMLRLAPSGPGARACRVVWQRDAEIGVEFVLRDAT